MSATLANTCRDRGPASTSTPYCVVALSMRTPPSPGSSFRSGRYALTFHVAEYFLARGVTLPVPAFLEDVVVRIGIAQPSEHYHVPLLITPWSYAVYRGG